MLTSELVTVRDFVEADRPFILSTWLKGLRYGNEWFECIEPKAYFSAYHAFLEKILKNPTTSVKVACLIEDPEVILGYAVYSGTRLDWVFVKKAWRAIGITKLIVPTKLEVVTHLTKVGKSILAKHPTVHFNPFVL